MIEAVSGIEAVRRRPHMYFGTDSISITTLAKEAMCLGLAQAACGAVTSIALRADGHTLTITDDGPGLALDVDGSGRTFPERAMTELSACRDHDAMLENKRLLCPVGLAAVNALASQSSISTGDGRSAWGQRYESGSPIDLFAELPTPIRGTTLEFTFDAQFVDDQLFDAGAIRAHLAAIEVDLNSLEFTILDER